MTRQQDYLLGKFDKIILGLIYGDHKVGKYVVVAQWVNLTNKLVWRPLKKILHEGHSIRYSMTAVQYDKLWSLLNMVIYKVVLQDYNGGWSIV